MKILIAYDGSDCADSAIDDLKRAGLPRRAEVIALTITDELIPSPTSIGGVVTTFDKDLLEKEKDSLALARRAQSRIQQLFPDWEISAETGVGSPGGEIIDRASDPGTAVNLAEWIARETERVKAAAEGAAEKLGSAGLKVSIVVGEREPITLLCDEADDFMADCIFVGSRGIGRLDRFLIGSVSLGVAARAHCSVEVVRKD